MNYPHIPVKLQKDPKLPSFFPFFLAFLVMLAIMILIFFGNAKAGEINLDIIAKIESNNNPFAYNAKTGASGMYQFLPIAWKDCQNHFPELRQYPFLYAYKPQVARLFAEAYIMVIKQYLSHYELKNTVFNQLWVYNAGINRVRQGIMPLETKNYIRRYYQYVQ